MSTKKASATQAISYYNINIKGAEIGGSWAIYFGLFSKRALGGTITETSFTITLPNDGKKTTLEIKNAKGKTVYTETFVPENDLNIDLTPPPEDQGKEEELLTKPLKKKAQERKQKSEGIEREEGREVKSRFLENELKKQVEERKEKSPKKSFWDRLK